MTGSERPSGVAELRPAPPWTAGPLAVREAEPCPNAVHPARPGHSWDHNGGADLRWYRPARGEQYAGVSVHAGRCTLCRAVLLAVTPYRQETPGGPAEYAAGLWELTGADLLWTL